ncbi:MAG: ATP-binding protein [Myxococcales bacterium]|nr:ATP-binding protein [Myxococcales bacterium]
MSGRTTTTSPERAVGLLSGSPSSLMIRPVTDLERLRQGTVHWIAVRGLAHPGECLEPSDFEVLFASLHGLGYRIAVFVHATPVGVYIALGVVMDPLDDRGHLTVAETADAVRRHLRARFPGSDVRVAEWKEIQQQVCSLDHLPHGGVVVGLPSAPEDDRAWRSPMRDLLLALDDKELVLLIVAEPLSATILGEEFERTNALMQAAASQEQRELTRTLQVNRTELERLAAGSDSSRSTEETNASQQSNEYRESTEVSATAGFSFGGASAAVKVAGSESLTSAVTLGRTLANSASQRWSKEQTQEVSTSDLQTVTQREDHRDVRAGLAVELLDEERRRLLQAMSIGAWRVGTYIAAVDRTTLLTAGQVLVGTLAGPGSSQAPLSFLEIAPTSMEVARDRWKALQPLTSALAGAEDSLTTLMHSGELALAAALPSESVPGFEVRQAVRFAQSVPTQPAAEPVVALGRIHSHGRTLDQRVAEVPVRTLTMHSLVCGTTGSGKSTTVARMLRDLWRHHRVPFLVVDPKEEYRILLQDVPDLQVIGPGASGRRLNPFQVPAGRSVALHAEHLRALFCATFDTEAAIPQVLQQAILEVYRQRGWDLEANTCRDSARPFPTLTDLQNELPRTIERNGFAAELGRNYNAAVGSRVRSLRLGWKRALLDGAESPDLEAALLSRPTVLDVGEMDADGRAFLMGLLLLRLTGVRRSQGRSAELRHLLVLEEAHHLLRNPASVGGGTTGTRARAMESMLDAIAEVRAFGQGILIADQSPGELHPGVLRSTNLKILHRILEGDDQDVAGRAAGLDELQCRELGRLEVGRAAVRAAGWTSAVLLDMGP